MNSVFKAVAILEVDLAEELLSISKDPEGERGKTLARRLRDHPEGGVELVISCVKDIAALLKMGHREEAHLKEVIEDL